MNERMTKRPRPGFQDDFLQGRLPDVLCINFLPKEPSTGSDQILYRAMSAP